MKTLYISHCTEYEAGWGSKSDGVLIGKTVEAMKKRIDELYENESYEIFWRYTDPEEVKCDDKTYDEICALMNIVAEKRGVENMSNGGKNNVIFCRTNEIPKMVQATAAIMTLNKK